MFGNIDIKVRPVKLAFIVEPNNTDQIRNAIRLSSSLWGGTYFPIIPLYERMPSTWEDKPIAPPPAKKVIQGYLDAFDPDALVQFSKTVPNFISESGIEIIKPDDIWRSLAEGNLSPQCGIGIFEVMSDIFDQYFKYKSKYPVKVVLPKIPSKLSLFWTSFLGELPPAVNAVVEKRYSEPLEIKSVDVRSDKLPEIMAGDVLFPRRMTQWALDPRNRSGSRRDARVFFLDATKPADIIDFWNLRALGGPVLPVPKQLVDDPQIVLPQLEMEKAFVR
jgi:hypothetical protein